MTRNSLIAALALVTGCSDYSLVAQVDEPAVPATSTEAGSAEPEETVTAAGTVAVEVTEESIEEETSTEPVSADECTGFLINEGFGHSEETDSYVIFSLVGDSKIEVHQGEAAKFLFAVTAHKCGDVIFTGLTVVQSVIDYTPAQWVTDVEHSGKASSVTHLSGTAQFDPIDGYNCNADGYDQQIFYDWETAVTNPNLSGAMNEVYIDDATTEVFEFDFSATEYVPVGTSFDLYLIDPEWVDVGTGSKVWDTYYYLPSWETNLVSVRVTIVE